MTVNGLSSYEKDMSENVLLIAKMIIIFARVFDTF